MRRSFSLWRNLLHRGQVERELDDELHATIELLVSEKVAGGMDSRAARRAALVELGGVESIKERVREARAGSAVESVLQDLRYAVRLLRRNPVFAVTAALSLAIGIGATTTIFTVGNGLLLRAAPGVTDPGSLMDIVRLEDGGGQEIDPISYSDYVDIRRRTTAFNGVFAHQLTHESASMRVDDSVERVFVNLVTTNYFRVLGVPAAAGRVFGSGDGEVAGASPVVVLSHRFWNRRFAADPGIVGQTVRMNAQPFTIIGVAHEGFDGLSVVAPDLWVPTAMVAAFSMGSGSVLASRESDWLMVGGRLKSGISLDQASAQVKAVGEAIAREFPRPQTATWGVVVASPVPYGLRLIAAGFLGLLMIIVALVLVIACANVAGVLLARATVRRREIAVRTAVGAGRRRLVRQLLTETLLLFVLGGVLGLVLTRLLTSTVVLLLPAFPQQINLSLPLDLRVMLFSLALAFVASVLSGLAPALHASKADVVSALRDDAQGTSDRLRLRSAFVVAQVALSALLVVTAAVLVRAFDDRVSANLGFDASNVDLATVELIMAGYTDATGPTFAREIGERVRALPGVQRATVANSAPGPGGSFVRASVPGVSPPRGQPAFFMDLTITEPGFFDTLRIPLSSGRDFAAADRDVSEPVAIVGASAARQFWPGKDPIGQSLFVTVGATSETKQLVVVGVARDLNVGNRRSSAPLNLYVPLQQRYVQGLTVLARTTGVRSVAGDLRRLITEMNPNLPVLTAQALESQQNGPVETQLRIAAAVAGSVGIVGLLLAAIGVYGVTTYAVARRTREIGIRLSLGARRGEVVALVLKQGMLLVAIGCVIGLLLGVGVGRLLAGQSLGVQPPDIATLTGAAAIFTVVGLVACYVPVRRASRIGAMQALRYE